MKFCQHSSNFRQKFEAVLEYLSQRVTKIPPSSPAQSKDKGLMDNRHIMSIGNLILGANSVTVSYLFHYGSLLQNATDIITKCDSYFIIKCVRSLLQNVSGFLLQSAIVITNCGNFITKCDIYYKLRQYKRQRQRQIQECWNIQDGALCDNSQRPASKRQNFKGIIQFRQIIISKSKTFF